MGNEKGDTDKGLVGEAAQEHSQQEAYLTLEGLEREAVDFAVVKILERLIVAENMDNSEVIYRETGPDLFTLGAEGIYEDLLGKAITIANEEYAGGSFPSEDFLNLVVQAVTSYLKNSYEACLKSKSAQTGRAIGASVKAITDKDRRAVMASVRMSAQLAPNEKSALLVILKEPEDMTLLLEAIFLGVRDNELKPHAKNAYERLINGCDDTTILLEAFRSSRGHKELMTFDEMLFPKLLVNGANDETLREMFKGVEEGSTIADMLIDHLLSLKESVEDFLLFIGAGGSGFPSKAYLLEKWANHLQTLDVKEARPADYRNLFEQALRFPPEQAEQAEILFKRFVENCEDAGTLIDAFNKICNNRDAFSQGVAIMNKLLQSRGINRLALIVHGFNASNPLFDELFKAISRRYGYEEILSLGYKDEDNVFPSETTIRMKLGNFLLAALEEEGDEDLPEETYQKMLDLAKDPDTVEDVKPALLESIGKNCKDVGLVLSSFEHCCWKTEFTDIAKLTKAALLQRAAEPEAKKATLGGLFRHASRARHLEISNEILDEFMAGGAEASDLITLAMSSYPVSANVEILERLMLAILKADGGEEALMEKSKEVIRGFSTEQENITEEEQYMLLFIQLSAATPGSAAAKFRQKFVQSGIIRLQYYHDQGQDVLLLDDEPFYIESLPADLKPLLNNIAFFNSIQAVLRKGDQ